MKKAKKALALVLTAALALSAVPAQAADRSPALASKKTITAGKKGRAMSVSARKNYKKAGYTLKFASSKPKVATVNEKTGVIRAIKAGSKTNITCKFIKKGTKTVTKKMKLSVRAAAGGEETNTSFTASQTGEREIMVKGTDLKEDALKLTRNGNDVAATVTVAANGESALLTTEGRLTDAEYEIVNGEESITLQCERSTPVTIDVGDTIQATEKILEYNRQYTGRFVYVVRNQWGEDVTKNVSLTITVNGVTASVRKNPNGEGYLADAEGVIYPQTMTIGTATVSVNIFDTTYPNLNLSKSLVVSDRAVARAITFTEIYNPESEPFVERADASQFYYLFEIENTSGETVLDTRDAVVESLMIYANPGLTKLATAYTPDDVELVEKPDGTSSLGIRLAMASADDILTAGEGSITAMDSTSGVSGTGTFTVGYGTTVNSFRVIPPEYVVRGEDTEFEYEALDVEGNEVTDYAALREVVKGTPFQFMKEDGGPKLYLKASENLDVGYHSQFFRTTTNATSSVNFNVMKEARPAEIVGITDAGTGVVGTGTLEFKIDNFLFLDQYGRTMTTKQFNELQKYSVAVVYDEDDFTITSNNEPGRVPIVLSGNSVKLRPNRENTSNVVTFELRDSQGTKLQDITSDTMYDKVIRNRTEYSQFEQRIVSASADRISRYEVADINPIFLDADFKGNVEFSPKVQVYGILGNNARITLTANDYSVSVPGPGDLDALDGNGKGGIKVEISSEVTANDTTRVTSDGTLDKEQDFISGGTYVTSLKRMAQITINATGETLEKEVTISTEPRRMASFNLLDPDTGVAIKSRTMPISEFVEEVSGNNSGELNTSVFGTWVASYRDNYNIPDDKASLDGVAPNYYISDIESGSASVKPSVYRNGTSKPSVKDFVSGTSFTLTWDYGRGVTKSVGITIA